MGALDDVLDNTGKVADQEIAKMKQGQDLRAAQKAQALAAQQAQQANMASPTMNSRMK